MKLGIISDIHADHEHLEIALALLEKLGADQLLCAGDLVDGMTEGNRAAQRVKALNIPVVMGNHDHAFSRPPSDEWRSTVSHMYQQDDNVTESTAGYLASLPLKLNLEYEGVRIVLAHANTWDQTSYLFPAAKSFERFQRLARENMQDADVVILGHTHTPMRVQIGKLWVFNPGSVQGNRYMYRPTHTCAILRVPELEFEVYDILTGQRADPERLLLNPPD